MSNRPGIQILQHPNSRHNLVLTCPQYRSNDFYTFLRINTAQSRPRVVGTAMSARTSGAHEQKVFGLSYGHLNNVMPSSPPRDLPLAPNTVIQALCIGCDDENLKRHDYTEAVVSTVDDSILPKVMQVINVAEPSTRTFSIKIPQ